MNLAKYFSSISKDKKLIECTLFACLILLGIFIRFDDINKWQREPQKIFSDGEPMLTTSDGYFYLRLARDLAEDRYDIVDPMRTVPDLKLRPSPPPLLSRLTSFVHEAASISLDWIAVSLPALLSVLLAVPLYFLGKYFGGSVMALTTVAFALSSNAYFFKTTLGKYDTDCLNVVFTMTAALCFLKFASKKGAVRYVYFALGLLTYVLFLMWWDQVPTVVTGISLFPLLIALVFHYRPEKEEGMKFGLFLFVSVIAILFAQGGGVVREFWGSIRSLLSYISKEELLWFPQVGQSINEQTRFTFDELVRNSSNNLFVFVVGAAGVLGLYIKRLKDALFLLVPLALACLSFLFAMRFMIFLAPMLALGVGYAASQAWKMSKEKMYVFFVPLLVLCMVGLNVMSTEYTYPYSVFSSESVKGLKKARTLLPHGSLLWSTCDNGYLINYYADRPTMCDGQYHSGERSVYNAIPLATDDYRLSANFIHFFAARGQTGAHRVYEVFGKERGEALRLIKEILAAGPEKGRDIISRSPLVQDASMEGAGEWVEFFFPANQNPVYLFIDWRMLLGSSGIYAYGSWDIKKHEGVENLPVFYFLDAARDENKIVDLSKSMLADLDDGKVYLSGNTIPLSSARNKAVSGDKAVQYPASLVEVREPVRGVDGEDVKNETTLLEGHYHFEFDENNNFAMLIDQNVSRSVYYQLFFSDKSPFPEYFQPVSLNTPHYQIWKVLGDENKLMQP